MKKPEKKCPNCGSQDINWKTVYGPFGAPKYNGLCLGCNAVMRGRETPDLARGRELAGGKELNRKELYSLPGDVQLGYLREIQNGTNGYLNKK